MQNRDRGATPLPLILNFPENTTDALALTPSMVDRNIKGALKVFLEIQDRHERRLRSGFRRPHDRRSLLDDDFASHTGVKVLWGQATEVVLARFRKLPVHNVFVTRSDVGHMRFIRQSTGQQLRS
jgi:hypothetical protein